MATVEVAFSPLPAHVRTARLVATAVARRSGVSETLLDELRLAVGEACSHAVEAHQRHCPEEPVQVALSDRDGRFEIEVRHGGRKPDHAASGEDEPSADDSLSPSGIAMAVIAGLADEVSLSETATGMSLKMSWPLSGSMSAQAPA